MRVRNRIRTGLLCAVVFGLTGCGFSQTYISFGGKEDGQPAFCISTKPNCAAPGAPLRSIEVAQVDEDGKVLRVLWRAEAPAGWAGRTEIQKVVYGKAPAGWNDVTPPSGLTAGQHYAVNGSYFFSITHNGLITSEGAPDSHN